MPNEIEVTVTKLDIEKGIQLDSNACPVALALRRAFPNERVGVGIERYKIHGFQYETLPIKVQRFIKAFDAGASVQPITFSINPRRMLE